MGKEKSSKSSKRSAKDSDIDSEATTPLKVAKVQDSENEISYEELVSRVNHISKPLASKKLSKRLLKVVKKAAKQKCLRRGVKEVVKALRKGEKGFVVIAGDISPIDVISHVPVLCEDNSILYCFVPSKEHLGAAGSTKRPTSCVMVKTNPEYKDVYEECIADVKEMAAASS